MSLDHTLTAKIRHLSTHSEVILYCTNINIDLFGSLSDYLYVTPGPKGGRQLDLGEGLAKEIMEVIC